MRPPLVHTPDEHLALSRTLLVSAGVALAAGGINAVLAAWLGGLFAVGGMVGVSLFYLALAVFHRSLAVTNATQSGVSHDLAERVMTPAGNADKLPPDNGTSSQHHGRP